MLLVHQTGSVKVGEVVRYTLTYTPTLDRILPPPKHLAVKIKNTSAIPLRAAYLHGPYTLYVACYPSTFDPNTKHARAAEEGEPDYEPQLKAGGSWNAKLTVPEEVRSGVENGERDAQGKRMSFTWIIEVASQVLFSTTAAVHFELLVGRDEKSVSTGLTGGIQIGAAGAGVPGKLEDMQREKESAVQNKGVFSKAVRLAVDDTESLWNTPPFPSWGDGGVDVKEGPQHGDKRDEEAKKDKKQRKPKKVHLVVLTHGLHSNLGADMLFMKESIDTAAKHAREDAKKKKAEFRTQQMQDSNDFGRDAADLRSKSVPDVAIAPTEDISPNEEDEEQIIVRGFKGNAVKTERGIQYLGKRLAKYVLSLTYPDQPFLPVKSSLSRTITRSFTGSTSIDDPKIKPTHKHSSIVKDENFKDHDLPYRITSISFLSHSLGGLVQTYAVAYIQKHSPEFFQRIEPINFVAMASPFLGLSNENPVYVKFALDFGLVGRTGQDLGLTWRAPTIARSGWGAMVNGLVNDPHKDKQPDPGSKPLLRILPTGPAHVALKKFRNRTVYSNVVNDGIVPLRTSCLLFLDWRGLGRVEKARRENGLVGTMVNWGWSEMTGQNVSTAKSSRAPWHDFFSDSADSGRNSPNDLGATVPQAEASNDIDSVRTAHDRRDSTSTAVDSSTGEPREQNSSTWSTLMSYFRPQAGSKPRKASTPKMLRRGQVTSTEDEAASDTEKQESSDTDTPRRRGPVRGSSLYTNNSDGDNLEAPPRTTFFESAGDLLSPPLPPKHFILDPAARPRTIFHDRVYHPDDIPPPPLKRQRTFMKWNPTANSPSDISVPHEDLDRISSSKPDTSDAGPMKIEEKIARAYHKDMSWRKVLVRLEPDAHNNMIVRRMFANAYGWPVVKHMCDTHFAYTLAAQTRDEDETCEERAEAQDKAVGGAGEQVKGQLDPPDEKAKSEAEGVDRQPRRARTDHPGLDGQSISRSIESSSPPASSTRTRALLHLSIPRSPSRSPSSKPDRPRTHSEIRESRDTVPDLVSMVTAQGEPSSAFNSMHSGGNTSGTSGPSSSVGAAAILGRIHRQDSARWSDRFFEGSGDESESESEVEGVGRDRYRHRGEGERVGGRKGSEFSNYGEIEREGNEGKAKKILSSTTEQNVFVQEPEELDSVTTSGLTSRDEMVDHKSENHGDNSDDGLTKVVSPNTAAVGLNKTAAELVGGVGLGVEDIDVAKPSKS